MVRDELADGKRIGQLFSSEIHGHERGPLGRLAIAEADPDVEATTAGAFAYAIESEDGDRIAEAYVHPDRLRLEFVVGVDVAAEAGQEAGLRVRPKAVQPPRTIVFVESGADVKPTLRVVRTVAAERLDQPG